MNGKALVAVKEGNLDKLEKLFDQGINSNVRDADGQTLLYHAAANGNSQIVTWLLQHDASVLITNHTNRTALHIAAMNKDNGMLVDIVENVSRKTLKTLLDMKLNDDGLTALHIAAMHDRKADVLYLLECGANFEVPSKIGLKPINVTTDPSLQALFRTINMSFILAKNGSELLLNELDQCDSLAFISTMNCRNNAGRTITQVLVDDQREKLIYELLRLRTFKPDGERGFGTTFCPDRAKQMDKFSELIREYRKFWKVEIVYMKSLVSRLGSNEEVDGKKLTRVGFKTLRNNLMKTCCRVLKRIHEIFLAYRMFSGNTTLTANTSMRTIEEVLEILGFQPDQLYVNGPKEDSYSKKLPARWKTKVKALTYLVESVIHHAVDLFAERLNRLQLIYAIAENGVEKVQRLLDNNTYVENIDGNNRTVLSYAVEHGRRTIVRMLLTAGAKVAQYSDRADPAYHIISPVYLAADKGHAKIVKLLLKHVESNDVAAFIDYQSVAKRTALHAAATKGRLDIVLTLLSYGATYCIFDEDGRTPLDVSSSKEISDFLKLIDECFHDAAKGNIEIVRKLNTMRTEEFLAATSTKNKDGRTIAFVAAKGNAKNIAVVILSMIREAKGRKD